MKKYQLTEDMAQYRTYWMTQILAGPEQGDGQERRERKDRLRLTVGVNCQNLVFPKLVSDEGLVTRHCSVLFV